MTYDLETLTQKIRDRLELAPPIGARVKFDFGESGIVLVDGRSSPAEVSNTDSDAECTLLCTPETFVDIVKGVQDPALAFMTGKLRVQGSVGIAMKLNAILEG